MKFFDSILLALHGISANKLRSSLTMLGIVIGVAAVISLMSIGQGAQTFITQQIQGIGTNLLIIFPGQAATQGVKTGSGTAILTLDDAKALNDPILAPDVVLVAPASQNVTTIVAGSMNTRSPVLGVTPEYQYVRNWEVQNGEFIMPYHMEARSLVAVLGSETAKTLFGGTNPVDQYIKVQQIQFRVIGVLKPKGGTGFGSADDVVMVPLTTMLSRLQAQRDRGQNRVSNINVMVSDPENIALAKEQISEILRTRHRVPPGGEDFNVLSQEDMLATLSSVTAVMTIFLGAIAGISLLVGGIGIMNIMLVTVTERTREIGIRKAVGAKRRDIQFQFLIESATLSLSGAVIGYLLGIFLSKLIDGRELAACTILRTTVTPGISVLALGVAVAIGLFFGIYPARRAAQMDPIQALKYE